MKRILIFGVLILVLLTGGYTADWGLFERFLQREKKDAVVVEQAYAIPVSNIFVDPVLIPNTIPFPQY